MPGIYRPTNYHPTTPGDSGAVRGYAAKLRSAAKSLQSISDDADAQVYFYSDSWQGAWKDQFLAMWDEQITASDQLNASAWGQDRANFIKANPRLARLYDANNSQSQGAFRSLIDACNQMADSLDQYAHTIDQEVAQEWDIFLDILIIAASIVVTALSFGALGPEAAMLDIFVVGATIGGFTSAAIDFSNQMVNNIVINHDSFGGALGNINMQELASAYITGYIVGGVSSVVGMGLPAVLNSAGGVFKAAVSNTVLKIGVEAVGFGAGTFVGDVAAQEFLSLDTKLRLTPVDWGSAGKDALTATAGGVVFGGLMHGLGIGGRAPDTAAGVDPTSQQWGIGVTTLDETGGKLSYFALSDPKGGPDLTLFEGSPTSVAQEIGPARLIDGTTLVTNDGSINIDLAKPGTDMLVQTPRSSSWINVDQSGSARFVAEAGVSDGSIKFSVVPGEKGVPPDFNFDPNTGDMQVPKDWKVLADYNAGTVRVTPPGSGDTSFSFSLRDPGAQSWTGADPKMIAGPATTGGDSGAGGGVSPNATSGDSSPELSLQTVDKPTVIEGTVVDRPAGPPIDPSTGSGGQQTGGGLRLEPAAAPKPTETPANPPGTQSGDPAQQGQQAGNPQSKGASPDKFWGRGGDGQPVAHQDEMVQALRQIDGLKPDVWKTLDPGQRVDVLQKVENTVANIQGRQPLPVESARLKFGTLGEFDPNTNTIKVNEIALKHGSLMDALGHMLNASGSEESILETVLHEGRHAYQWTALFNPGLEPNADLVSAWGDNYRNYQSPSDWNPFQYHKYWTQPLEVDARSYEPMARMVLDGINDPQPPLTDVSGQPTQPLPDISDLPTQPLPDISRQPTQPLPGIRPGGESGQPPRPQLARALPPEQSGEQLPTPLEALGQGSGGTPGIPKGLAAAWDGTIRADGPMVRIPVDPTGAPARGLEGAAGPTNTDLGVTTDFTQGQGGSIANPDPNLVDLTRTDIVTRNGVQQLDLTQPIPPQFHDQDFAIINNPHGFNVDIANVGQALRPGGRLIIQGRAEVVPGMRPSNPVMNRLLAAVRSGQVPAGFRVVEVLTDPSVPGGARGNPTLVPKPDWVLGGSDGPFHQTSGGNVSWPNTRIIVERMVDPTDTSLPRVVPETHVAQPIALAGPEAGPRQSTPAAPPGPPDLPPGQRPQLARAVPPDPQGVGAEDAAAREREAAAIAAVADTSGWIKRYGAAGEAAELQGLTQRGAAAADLNGLPSVGGGKNFPLLDNVSSEGFASTKVKMGATFDPIVPPARLRAYSRDFSNLLDQGRSAAAAEALTDPRNQAAIQELQARGAWPQGLSANPKAAEVATFIQEHARLSIPEDHVPQVQGFLRRDIREFPTNYGFAEGVTPTNAQIEQLVGRVQSNGITSIRIHEMVNLTGPARTEPPKLWGRGGEQPPVGRHDEIVQALRQIDGLRPDVWGRFDPAQRVNVLQTVENTVADIQGRPRMLVVSAKLEGGEVGRYDPATRTILVDQTALERGSRGAERDALETVLHEGRHAYQDFAIDNPGFHANADQVEAWRVNWLHDNYEKPSFWNPVQQHRYTAQPLEADARSIEPIAREVLGGIGESGQRPPAPQGPHGPPEPPQAPAPRPSGPPAQRAQPSRALPPGFDPSLVEPTGALMPAAAVVREQLAGPAVVISKGLLGRVVEVDAALRALGTQPGARLSAERALNALQSSIAEAGKALDLYDVSQLRLHNEIELARSLSADQRPPQLAEVESLASNHAGDAMVATLDSAKGVLEAGQMRLAVEPPPTPAEFRAQHTQAAVDTLRADQVGQRERLWHEQQHQVAKAEPAQREVVRRQYAQARQLMVQQQELATVGLRVLAYITEWDPHKGGVVAVNRNLCLGLAEAGLDVFVRVGHEVAPGHVEGGVHVIGPRVYEPGVDERLQLLYGGEELPPAVDIVIGHSRFSGPAALQMRNERFPEARLVHIVHMVTDALGRVQGREEFGLRNQAIERDLVAQSDLAVGVGPVLRDEVERLAAMTGSTPGIHELVPGVPFEEPLAPPMGDHQPNILLFGRADDGQKGAAEAAMMVRELPPDVRLTVRGAPPETVERARARLSQIAGRAVDVRPFTIDRAEILGDMRDADVVIMPSRAEGFGLVGLEAAGAGVPILVPSTSGVGRFVGDSGLFPAEVARQSVVEQGFEDPVPVERWVARLRDVLGDLGAARQRALDLRLSLQEQNRTWKGAAESLVAAVRALADRPAPAPVEPPDEQEPRSGAASR